MITNLPLLRDKDYLFTPIDTFDLKGKESLTECSGVSVFVSIVKILLTLMNNKNYNYIDFIA